MRRTGRVRAGSDATGRSVGILADLQGPKIRLGEFPGGPVRLSAGDEFVITTEDIPGNQHEASTTYEGLADDVRAGDRILIDDGNVQLDVTGVSGSRVHLRVVVGGKISDHKGINLPGINVSAPALTDKDEADLRWALATGADIVAMSFVRSPDDASLARKIMTDMGRPDVPLIAKIEKPEAVNVLPDIVDAFDGIMVARGDLGVELPLEQVPTVQTRAIKLARERARPVIVATQMLESMISSPRPTRAEVSDVAGAVAAGRGRGDAVRRDQRRRLPDRDGRHHEQDRRRGRGVLAARRAPPVADADHHRRRDRARRRRGRRDRRGQGPGRVHDDRRDRAPPGQVPLADPAARVHHRPGHQEPARPHLGRRDVHRARPCGTPTTWCTRSTRPWSA